MKQGRKIMNPHKGTLTALAMACVFVAAALGAVVFAATPVAADIWYKGELSGPTAGKVGDTLTYSVQAWECSGSKPGETPSVPAGEVPGGSAYCSPLVGYFTTFSVGDQSSIKGYGSSTDQQGHVSVGIPFPKAGVYQIAAGAPKFATNVLTVTITQDKQPATPAQPDGNSGGGNSGGGNSGSSSESPSPTASSNNTAAVFGLEQVSASAGSGSGWMWILALGIIILLAIIVAVLLVTRRHPREEGYVPEDTSDYYRTGRR